MSIPGMSAGNHAIVSLIVKLLNKNQFRGSKWFFSRSTWRDSKQQMIYAGTKKLDVPWVELTHLVNEYIAWQENPKLALDFISNPENKMRFIGHMLCKHILEHGSILHAHKENPNR